MGEGHERVVGYETSTIRGKVNILKCSGVIRVDKRKISENHIFVEDRIKLLVFLQYPTPHPLMGVACKFVRKEAPLAGLSSEF